MKGMQGLICSVYNKERNAQIYRQLRECEWLDRLEFESATSDLYTPYCLVLETNFVLFVFFSLYGNLPSLCGVDVWILLSVLLNPHKGCRWK